VDLGYKDLDPRGRMVHLELEESSRALKVDEGGIPNMGRKKSPSELYADYINSEQSIQNVLVDFDVFISINTHDLANNSRPQSKFLLPGEVNSTT
jgi:hypothetical protein